MPTKILQDFHLLDAAVAFAVSAGQQDRALLVHCRMGINRSAAVACAILIRMSFLSAQKAMELMAAWYRYPDEDSIVAMLEARDPKNKGKGKGRSEANRKKGRHR